MPDEQPIITNQTTTPNPTAKIVIGVLLIIASVSIYFYSNNRVNPSDVAKQSENYSQNVTGKFVHTTGLIHTNEQIGDESYYIKKGDYLAMNRVPEMYSWIETSETGSGTNIYNYTNEWTQEPADSSEFQSQLGHMNPEMSITNSEMRVANIYIDSLNTIANDLRLPSYEDLSLSGDLLTNTGVEFNQEYIYSRLGSANNPQVGDIRLGYQVVPTNFTGTIFGKVENNTIMSYDTSDKGRLYRIFYGTYDDAIKTLQNEYNGNGMAFMIVYIILFVAGLFLVISSLFAKPTKTINIT